MDFSPEVLVVKRDQGCEEKLIGLVQDLDGVVQLLVPGDQDIARLTNWNTLMNIRKKRTRALYYET